MSKDTPTTLTAFGAMWKRDDCTWSMAFIESPELPLMYLSYGHTEAGAYDLIVCGGLGLLGYPDAIPAPHAPALPDASNEAMVKELRELADWENRHFPGEMVGDKIEAILDKYERVKE